MEDTKTLHIAMFPWLAMGHLIPFIRLSELLAQKGHRISFISTPRNISCLPKLRSNLSALINLVSLPLPSRPDLPSDAESTMDVNNLQQQPLKHAFDQLRPALVDFLESSTPDWIIYDYASHWLPEVAAELGISRAYFSLFTAAFLAFIGPRSDLAKDERSTPEDFTVAPKWVPFESNIYYRLHETTKFVERIDGDKSGPSDLVRFAVSVEQSDIVMIRSCEEFEQDWFDLLRKLLEKPVIPVGFLPPATESDVGEDDSNWVGIKQWLDKQRSNSVVYVAFGTEPVLSHDELTQLALGLEKSELPFFWVLRNSPGSTQSTLEILRNGFTERVKGRGLVYDGWAPQVKILSHDSVGGFLTHCGWNSVVEGLSFGRVLALFPVTNDQGPNARLLEGKKLGVEIRRNERDGSFRSEWVAESLRLAMVDDPDKLLNRKAKEMMRCIQDKDRNEGYLGRLARYLEEERRQVG
ncbi:hypothetical protein SLA2020_333470 [Shorea laevis]